MPRTLLVVSATVAAALTLGAGTALAQEPPALAPPLVPALVPAPPPAPPPAPVQVDWRLEQAGRDALSLDLSAYGSGSCLPGRVSASAVESATRIRVTVVVPLAAGELCTTDYRATPVTVRLAAPVGGRSIVGPRRLPDPRRTPAPPPADPLRVPRVTGLAPADAVAVTRLHGLRPQLERVADLRSRPRTIGQTPASGRVTRARAVVTLFVSR